MNVLKVSEEFKEYAIRPFPKGQTAHIEFSKDKKNLILVEKSTNLVSIYDWKNFNSPLYQIPLSVNYFKNFLSFPLLKLYMLAKGIFLMFFKDNSFRLVDTNRTQGMLFMKSHLNFNFKPAESTLLVFDLLPRAMPLVFTKVFYQDKIILFRIFSVF